MGRRAKGEGSVYYNEDRGRWVGQADAGLNPSTGKRRRVKVIGSPGESKSSVAARLRERIDHLSQTTASAPETVGQLVDSWLSRSAPRRMDARTLAMVESMVRLHLVPVLGGVRVQALTVEDVEGWLDAKSDRLAKSSLIKLRSYLALSFDHGLRRRHVTWNPARVAELPVDATGKREGRALTVPEAKALLNAAMQPYDAEAKPDETGVRLGGWVVLGLTLGLRPGEISGLTWEAIDGDKVTVYQSMGWTGGKPQLKGTKTGGSRTLTLPAPAQEALRRHRKAQASERLLMAGRWPLRWESLVFVTSNGTPLDPSNVRRLVAKLARDAGIEGTVAPYDLRHSATSLLAAAGHSADRLADLLGHQDTRMVWKHYRHSINESVEVAADYWRDTGTG